MLIRRFLYQYHWRRSRRFPVPVIVAGNITVGGTGKTPLVIALADWLQRDGWRPGIVSRGYGGNATVPESVTAGSDPHLVGDESIMLARKTGCPVVVCRRRVAAADILLRDFNCNIVISDDGLQHLALERDIEIAVLDGHRRFGNGFCLPAGPLREPISRLKTVDFRVNNGAEASGEWRMDLLPENIYSLCDPSRRMPLERWRGCTVHAVAGIGHPQRFFKTLVQAGLQIICHPFPDHYFFKKMDLDFGDGLPVIMTEKDAIKCRAFANEKHWCLEVRAELSEDFFIKIRHALGTCTK